MFGDDFFRLRGELGGLRRFLSVPFASHAHPPTLSLPLKSKAAHLGQAARRPRRNQAGIGDDGQGDEGREDERVESTHSG